MTVYIVIFGYHYEGEDANTARVFSSKEAARNYARRTNIGDYFVIIDREVEDEHQ